MAQIDLNPGASYYDPTADPVKDSFDNCQSNFDELYAFNAAKNPDNVRVEIVSIGGWDMDTDGSKTVAYTPPVGFAVVGLQALIYPDTDETQQIYPIDYLNNFEGDYVVNGGISYLNNNIYLWRRTGVGYLFDSTAYNSAAATRGYIKVETVPIPLT